MTRVRGKLWSRSRQAAAGLAAVLAIASSPALAQDATFSVPKGWTQKQAAAGRASWDHNGQTLRLEIHVNRRAPDDFFKNVLLAEVKSLPSVYIRSRRRVKLCGGRQTGWLLAYVARPHKARKLFVELAATADSRNSYVAGYLRRAGQPVRSDAERALLSLCRGKR